MSVRLAMASTVAVVVGFCAIDMGYVIPEGHAAPSVLLALGCFALICVLQLSHSFPDVFHLPGRTRHWALALQAVLCFAPMLVYGQAFLGMPPLLAGAVLLVLPPGAAWPLCVAALVANDVAVVALGDGYDLAYGSVDEFLTVLLVVGLPRFTYLVAEVHRTRGELAARAVTEERLRFARDLHDVLGHSLSTITLKCELANRLVLRDRDRALAEIDQVLQTSRKALADVRTVARGYRPMSLAEEAATARSMLADADIRATVRVEVGDALDPGTETLLATVLRESLTNVLRYSKAETCTVTAATTDRSTVTLRIGNDGARSTTARDCEAAGLGNLAARVARHGGSLTTRWRGDWFHVTAEVGLEAGRTGAGEDSEHRHQGAAEWLRRAPAPAVRTATVLTGAALCAYLVRGAARMHEQHVYGAALVAATAVLLPGLALQAWQIFPRLLPGHRLRHRRTLLAAQALLAFLPYLWLGRQWWGEPGMVAGTALLVLSRPQSWAAYAGVVVGNQALLYALGLRAFTEVSYGLFMTALTGLAVYGLARLHDLVTEVHRSRAEMARHAVTSERLRFARDLHDLLGYSLSTITLKCELARRLVPLNPQRARLEITEVLQTSRQALADVRTVAEGYRPMSLADEATAARSVLAASEIRTTLQLVPTPRLSEDADTVLATVLREALTNMLRHSRAERCSIATSLTQRGTVRLSVANDGVESAGPSAAPGDQGSGIGNLRTRVGRLGGTLTTVHEESWFRLTAEVPTDSRLPAREEQPA